MLVTLTRSNGTKKEPGIYNTRYIKYIEPNNKSGTETWICMDTIATDGTKPEKKFCVTESVEVITKLIEK